jgi:serine/threonine protein phosphatase 1
MIRKTFVIGDIHGGLKALVQVLERATVSKNDTLIFLGDFVDGWSESPAVLDFLIALEKTTIAFL